MPKIQAVSTESVCDLSQWILDELVAARAAGDLHLWRTCEAALRVSYNVWPATAVAALSLLAENGVLRRGDDKFWYLRSAAFTSRAFRADA